MKVYVKGTVPGEGSEANALVERFTPQGYDFHKENGYFHFVKKAPIESVITELVPTCEKYHFDVEDFKLVEYDGQDNEVQARYLDGRIIRE